jgi:hypothetical protein
VRCHVCWIAELGDGGAKWGGRCPRASRRKSAIRRRERPEERRVIAAGQPTLVSRLTGKWSFWANLVDSPQGILFHRLMQSQIPACHAIASSPFTLSFAADTELTYLQPSHSRPIAQSCFIEIHTRLRTNAIAQTTARGERSVCKSAVTAAIGSREESAP